MTSYKYLGYGVTDSNGVAHLKYDKDGHEISPQGYHGTGAGEVDVIASVDKPITSSSIVSGTYPVIDATWIDDGKENPSTDYWYNQQNCSVSRDSECCTVTEDGGNLIYRLKGTYAFQTGTCIEFDFYQVDGITSNSIIGFATTAASFSTYFNLANAGGSIGEWKHIKLEWKDGYVTINGDTANKKVFTPSTDNALFGFLTVGDCTAVKFKNFVVYPI